MKTWIAIWTLALASCIQAAAIAPVNREATEPHVRSARGSNVLKWGVRTGKLSLARSDISAASVGQKAVFAGGRLDDGTYTTKVDIYNRQTNKWSTHKLSQARSGISAGVLANRYIVFAGGFDKSYKKLTTIDVYDSQTNQWKVIQLKHGRSSPALIEFGDSLAIVGGLSDDLNYLDQNVEYLDSNLKLTEGKNLARAYPQFGNAASLPARNQGIYTAGYENQKPGQRFNDFQASSSTVLFSTDGWKEGPAFPHPRWGTRAGAAGSIAAVGGGTLMYPLPYDKDVPVLVDVFCFEESRWCKELKLKEAHAYPYVGTVKDYIVFAGGENSTTVEALDSRTIELANLDESVKLQEAHFNAAATVVDQCLFVLAGGFPYGGGSTDLVQFIDAC